MGARRNRYRLRSGGDVRNPAYLPTPSPFYGEGWGVILPSEQSLSFADTPLGALNNANSLIIVTEWEAFKSPDFNVIKARLKQPVIFDGRNMFEPKKIKAMDIEYYVIGRECGATINREV